METPQKPITVECTIDASADKVWKLWTEPNHIMQWNNASPDWHTPYAENDLRQGGRFSSRMEAKDGSMGFDFGGIYDIVRTHEYISYTLDDGRKVEVIFSGEGKRTTISETFEPERTNPVEMQRSGWQAILDNFRAYSQSAL